MARFNSYVQQTPAGRVYNASGGLAFKQNPKTELAGLIFTSFAKDQFYEQFDKTHSRLRDLIITCGPVYASECALIARKTFGLRSISHLVAAEVSRLQKMDPGHAWQGFYEDVILRPDDMEEILALTKGKMTHAMKRAFKKKMEGFDDYQLGKYAKFNKIRAINLNDIVRLTHAKVPGLVHRTIPIPETWETMGNSRETWKYLIENNKLPYLAMLRNLRNIEQTGDLELIGEVALRLVDPERISKARIFPFQFLKAYENTSAFKASVAEACEIALGNMPVFEGRTLVLLDVSGSMQQQYNIQKTAAMFAFALKSSSKIMLQFDTKCRPLSGKGVGLLHNVHNHDFRGGGTDFRCAFNYMRDHNVTCDRVIILTDNEHWVDRDSSYGAFLEWQETVNGKRPEVWTIELASYGTSQFPQDKVRQLFGFSEKMFEVIPFLESN